MNNFNRYLDDSLEYEDFDRLMSKLTTGVTPTSKMIFGTACHAFLEDPAKAQKTDNGYLIENRADEQSIGGKTTLITTIEAGPLITFNKAHPFAVYEQRHKKIYEVGDYLVDMSGIIDCMEFSTIYDFKIIESKFDVENYLNSVQWKFYLDMTELSEFQYTIFKRAGRIPNKRLDQMPPIVCYPYDRMHDDLVDLLRRFLKFLEEYNLINNYLYE